MTYTVKTYNQIAPEGLNFLKQAGYIVEDSDHPDAILLRSHSLHQQKLTDSVLAIGRAGAGTNNIPIDTCTSQGIAVFNTPGANANAVKELVLANLLLAVRPILKGTEWINHLDSHAISSEVEINKKQFAGTELEGKTLGVIGLGAIGSRVANDAYQIGMNVLGYDPHVSIDTAWKMSRRVQRVLDLQDIFSEADFITIHIPLLPETKHFIGKKELSKMKPNTVLLNFSRGELVDNPAVLKAAANGGIAKYITDFPVEELLHQPNITLLPHLGASTEEAEINCAKSAARTLQYYLETGNIRHSVNLPTVDMTFNSPYRISVLHQNIPNMIGAISQLVAQKNINIHNLTNRSRGEVAYTLVDLDETALDMAQSIVSDIQQNSAVIRTRLITNTKI
ncbi:3-phosphoglycerate dehydrogenase family protein [Vagococcus vulneris]|uniref:D-3-phosphoglycerate dehydrogenase n=1 Tax=Vagococcus vulneris TaxID=1977869 RepID=A0A430A0I9_9ENTE|nr:3-phosphoglycerate dehydrogenase family protein [Vagococcus vulneris]RST99848.1 3-phosphoglycerate dehydrogenase [Vagococcus vulneris]